MLKFGEFGGNYCHCGFETIDYDEFVAHCRECRVPEGWTKLTNAEMVELLNVKYEHFTDDSFRLTYGFSFDAWQQELKDEEYKLINGKLYKRNDL